MMKLINCFFFLLFALTVNAQRCALGIMANPDLQKRHEAMQKVLDVYENSTYPKHRIQEGIIQIPIVVHVIHNRIGGDIGGNNNTNISDQQIFSQIKALNEDFRRKQGTLGFNANPVGSDMQIEFFLAQQDDFGNPSSGITRTYFNKNTFDVFSDLGQIAKLSYWDSNKFLNIWVVDFSGVYLGYGEFPGAAVDGLELTDPPEKTDGIFIDYEAFGRKNGTANNGLYSFGRTLTHEVGHWLGLLHTWGDTRCGTDYCSDTPQAERENDSETCRDIFSRCTGVASRNMIENYMDYTPDSCMNIFTTDQKNRVRTVLELSPRRRRLVLNSQFLLPSNDVVALKVISNPGDQSKLAFQILLPGFQDFSLRFFDVFGREVGFRNFKDYPSTVVRASDLKIPTGLLIMQMISGNIEITKRIMVL